MLQVLPNFLFGVQATGNLGNARIKDMADFSYCKSMQVKPGGGLVAAYGINDKIAIRSGINFLQHGARIKALTRKPPNDYPHQNIWPGYTSFMQGGVQFKCDLPAGARRHTLPALCKTRPVIRYSGSKPGNCRLNQAPGN